jgi:putative transposase
MSRRSPTRSMSTAGGWWCATATTPNGMWSRRRVRCRFGSRGSTTSASTRPPGSGNVLATLPKSAHKDAKAALAEIYNAEDRDHAEQAAKAFAAAYGAKWPKAVTKITNDLDVLLAFYDFPGEHWIHLRTTNPIESTFATVRLRQRVTKAPGSRAAGIAMAFKRIESAQHHWRAVNSAHLVALVRAGAKFENGVLVERPDESISKR